jgi:hypothetical protein
VTKLLEGKLTPERKAHLMAAIARLQPDDEKSLDKLHALLDNDRVQVRRAAIEALAKAGNADSLDKLLVRREKEELPGVVNNLDEAIEKLRDRLAEPDAVRKELENLREQNQKLEERLKKLEAERANG